MKRIFLFSLLVVFSFSTIKAQELIDVIAAEVCDCLENEISNTDELDSTALIQKCITPSVFKHMDKIKAEYGDDTFDEGSNKPHEIGIEIGQNLAINCSNYVELLTDQSTQNTASRYYTQAEILNDEGKYYEAEVLYTRAIELSPNEINYINARGVSFFNQKKYYKAIADFYRAYHINPNDKLILFNISHSMYQLNDYKSALELINTSLSNDSLYAESYNLKGLILDNLDEKEEMIECFTKAQNLEPNSNTFKYNVGYGYYQLENYEESLKWFLESYDEKSGSMHLNYIGEHKSAVEYYSKAIEIKPDNYIFLYNRGLSNYKSEEYAAALADFQAAFEIEDNDRDIYEYLAKSYNQTGEYDKAIENINLLIENIPEEAKYFDIRAGIYINLKKIELAIEDYKTSLILYPEDCSLYKVISDLYSQISDDSNKDAWLEKYNNSECSEKE